MMKCNRMIACEVDGVQWLEFELLKPFPKLKHAVFLRHGGVSTGNFVSLNLSDSVGDDPRSVAANREKARGIVGAKSLLFSKQVHGCVVVEARSEGEFTCDALTTDVPGVGLAVTHADCQAAIFYDPVHHAVANVHSGWRGSVGNIYAETVQFMQRRYGTKPADLHVAISPSLGPEKAEFVNFRTELPEAFWEYQVKPFHFDFWQISRSQLEACGVPEHHIQIAGICTFSVTEDYFSYRREKITGRHGTAVVLM